MTGLDPWYNRGDASLESDWKAKNYSSPVDEINSINKIDAYYGAFAQRCFSIRKTGRPTAAVAEKALKRFVEYEAEKTELST